MFSTELTQPVENSTTFILTFYCMILYTYNFRIYQQLNSNLSSNMYANSLT